MLWRWRNTISRFMAGRNGGDELNRLLLVLYLVVWILTRFWRSGIASFILSGVLLLLFGGILFRTLSRDLPRRQAENARYLRLRWPVRCFLKRQWDRIRDIRRWRYRRCPACRAQLRLPIRRGKRTVTCSRCGNRFSAFFL